MCWMCDGNQDQPNEPAMKKSIPPVPDLCRIAQTLLDEHAPINAIVAAVESFHAMASSITGVLLDRRTAQDGQDLDLKYGKAIAPGRAAECLFEYRRTQKFVQGLHAAIREARQRFLNRRIHIVYAGCGPYASLAIPMIPLFRPDEVKFTIIDAQEASIRAAERWIAALGADEYFTQRIVGDAITHRFPSHDPIHVAVCEAMNAALGKEPQIAITANLANRLAEGGLLVPESVRVEAMWSDWNREYQRMLGLIDPAIDRTSLGTVFELTLTSARPIRIDSPEGFVLPLKTFTINKIYPGQRLALFTSINVFGGIRLGYFECSLTSPVLLKPDVPLASGDRITFEYRLSPAPGFICQAQSSSRPEASRPLTVP